MPKLLTHAITYLTLRVGSFLEAADHAPSYVSYSKMLLPSMFAHLSPKPLQAMLQSTAPFPRRVQQRPRFSDTWSQLVKGFYQVFYKGVIGVYKAHIWVLRELLRGCKRL